MTVKYIPVTWIVYGMVNVGSIGKSRKFSCKNKPTGQAAKVGALVGTILFPASKTLASKEVVWVEFWFVSNQEMPRSCNSGKIIITILLRDLNWPSKNPLLQCLGRTQTYQPVINMQHQLGVTGGWKAMAFLWWCSHRRVFEYSGNIGPARIMGVSPEFTEWSLILINRNMLYSLTIVKLLDILYCTCMLKSPQTLRRSCVVWVQHAAIGFWMKVRWTMLGDPNLKRRVEEDLVWQLQVTVNRSNT